MIGDEAVEAFDGQSGGGVRDRGVSKRPQERRAGRTARGDLAAPPDQMPGREALFRGQRGDEGHGRAVRQRQQRDAVVAVENGDDTRREPAEPSGSVVQNDRPQNALAHAGPLCPVPRLAR